MKTKTVRTAFSAKPPPRTATYLRATLAIALAALVACGKPEAVDTPTQVMVRVTSTDNALLQMLTQLRVSASVRGAKGWRAPVANTFEASSLKWPVDVPTLPRNTSDAGRELEVVVEALEGGRVLAQTRTITRFIANRHILLELSLFLCAGEPGRVCARDCQGSDCSVCTQAGVCERVSQVDPNRLPDQGTTIDEILGTGPDAGAVTLEAGAVSLELDAGEARDSSTQTSTLTDARVETPSGAQSEADGMSAAPVAAPCVGNPDKAVCAGALLHRCNAQGESDTTELCASGGLCQLGVAGKACPPCNPATFRCTGTQLERCANNGARWEAFKTCDSAALCNIVAGDCIAGACKASTRVCMANDLYGCSQDLTRLERVQSCAVGLCDPVDGECDNCIANARTCNGGYAEICDGKGRTLTRTQCTGATSKCSAGQCVQCTLATDCAAPSNTCLTATCNTTTARCAMTNKPAHQACAGGVCNGSGACVQCVSDADCTSGQFCDRGSCRDRQPLAAGTTLFGNCTVTLNAGYELGPGDIPVLTPPTNVVALTEGFTTVATFTMHNGKGGGSTNRPVPSSTQVRTFTVVGPSGTTCSFRQDSSSTITFTFTDASNTRQTYQLQAYRL